MSKFKDLILTVLKEAGNYPDGFDDSILDGNPNESGDWLESQFAIKIIGGTDNAGETYGNYPAYVYYDKQSNQLDITEDLLGSSNSVDIKTGKYKRTWQSAFIKKEEAEQIANNFKKEYPGLQLQIIEVYGYNDDDPYYEDPSKAVEAYLDDYEIDQASSYPEYDDYDY